MNSGSTPDSPKIGSQWVHSDLQKTFEVTALTWDGTFGEYYVEAKDINGHAKITMFIPDFFRKMTPNECIDSYEESIKQYETRPDCTCKSMDLFNYGCRCGHFKKIDNRNRNI